MLIVACGVGSRRRAQRACVASFGILFWAPFRLARHYLMTGEVGPHEHETPHDPRLCVALVGSATVTVSTGRCPC